MTKNINTDWTAFYQEVQGQIKIPATFMEEYGRTQIVVRDLLVNLSDVYTKIRQKGLKPGIVSIYADVVKVLSDIDPVISETSLFIAARRIEIERGANIILDYRSSPAGKLVIYAKEIGGQIQAKAITISENAPHVIPFNLSILEKIGVVISCKDKTPTLASLPSIDDSGLQLGSQMRLSLTSIFQLATAVFDIHPEIARSMLNWIIGATKGSKVALDLYLQSSALLAQLNVSKSSVTFVPYLDKDVYTDIASSFLEAAKAYEQQYERFSDRQLNLADRKKTANLMLKYYQDTTDFNQQLINQATDKFQATQKILTQTGVSLKIQKSQVQTARIEFEYDAKIWVHEQILQAVLSMIFALVELVGAIALMAVGDAAAGTQAGAAVTQGTKAAETASKVAEEVKEVSQFAKTLEKLADVMKELKDISDALQKTYESISKIVEASRAISEMVDVVDVTIPSVDDISAQAQWDAFRTEADALLKPAIDFQVPGALEYQVALDKLAIYGRAFMASQVAVVSTGQALARLYLQKQVSANQEERLTQYINKFSETAESNDEIMQIFFERELNIKRWLFIAIQNYTWAYRYWALRNSRVQLSIFKSVQNLQEDLGTVQQEYAEVLQSFNPPPQPFTGITIPIEDTNKGQYNKVIANLRQNRSSSFSVEFADPVFNGLGRIRLTTVRVWLEGVEASTAQPLCIDITGSGIYSDRLFGKTHHFISDTFRRVFKYNKTLGNVNGILVDGKVDDREKYLYFQPTPFTQWTIKVPEELNPGIDLSTLRSLKIEFCGSAIATLDDIQ